MKGLSKQVYLRRQAKFMAKKRPEASLFDLRRDERGEIYYGASDNLSLL